MVANSQHQSVLERLIPKPTIAWMGIASLTLITTVLLLGRAGKILNFAFPLLSLLLGILLYRRYPVLYAGYNWWVWFLAAFIRRYADFGSGFTEPSPILLAPFLVSLVSGIRLLKKLPNAHRVGAIPFILALAGVAYGFCIGIINHPISGVLTATLEWVSPIAFGSFLLLEWRDYPLYRKNIQTVFLFAVLVSGAYGVYQYMVAPPWDALWLTETQMISAGKPEPLGIRVWSTMHSPGVFGPMMMVGLLLLLNSTRALGIPAATVGYLSFLLSQVRAAWVGWFVGFLSLITTLKPKFKMRLTVFAVIVVLCVVPLATVEPFASIIIPRLETLSDIESDSSGQARRETYVEYFNEISTNFIGHGIVKVGALDSGIISIFFHLGWIGALLYSLGIVLVLFQIAQKPRIVADPFTDSAQAVTYAMATQLVFGSGMLGLPGLLLWGFAAMTLAAHKYHLHQIKTMSLVEAPELNQ